MCTKIIILHHYILHRACSLSSQDPFLSTMHLLVNPPPKINEWLIHVKYGMFACTVTNTMPALAMMSPVFAHFAANNIATTNTQHHRQYWCWGINTILGRKKTTFVALQEGPFDTTKNSTSPRRIPGHHALFSNCSTFQHQEVLRWKSGYICTHTYVSVL